MFPCLDPLGLLVCLSRYHSLMIGEEKPSVAISGRSSHKMTGLYGGGRLLLSQHFQQARTLLKNSKTKDKEFISFQQDKTKCKS